MIVAIIPARGGSKRIPKKNIKNFAGRPMIEYSIEAAQKSGVFDRIIVSTDSDEIAEVASSAGAETPFRRPAPLADDFATTKEVLDHAIGWLQETGAEPKHFACIYSTAPFLTAESIRKGHEILVEKNAPAVFSVTTFDFPIFRGLKIASDGRLEMIWPEHELTRSNDLMAAYHDAGQLYWFNIDVYRKTPKIWAVRPLPLLLPRAMVQDIDTPEDWEVAENLFRALKRSNK